MGISLGEPSLRRAQRYANGDRGRDSWMKRREAVADSAILTKLRRYKHLHTFAANEARRLVIHVWANARKRKYAKVLRSSFSHIG